MAATTPLLAQQPSSLPSDGFNIVCFRTCTARPAEDRYNRPYEKSPWGGRAVAPTEEFHHQTVRQTREGGGLYPPYLLQSHILGKLLILVLVIRIPVAFFHLRKHALWIAIC
jgi:hypothetical protein